MEPVIKKDKQAVIPSIRGSQSCQVHRDTRQQWMGQGNKRLVGGKMRRSGDSGGDDHTRTRPHTTPPEGMVKILKPGLEAWLRVLLPVYKALYHRK